jgi:hypothetical protein
LAAGAADVGADVVVGSASGDVGGGGAVDADADEVIPARVVDLVVELADAVDEVSGREEVDEVSFAGRRLVGELDRPAGGIAEWRGGGADAAEDALVEVVLVGVEAVEGLDGVDGEVGECVAGAVAVVGVGEFPEGGLEGGQEEDGGIFVVALAADGEASDELVVAGVVTLGEGVEQGCGCPSGEVRIVRPQAR